MEYIPVVSLSEFNNKVDAFAKDNFVLKALFENPKSKVKSWEDLPPHLLHSLFKKVGCKPINIPEPINN